MFWEFQILLNYELHHWILEVCHICSQAKGLSEWILLSDFLAQPIGQKPAEASHQKMGWARAREVAQRGLWPWLWIWQATHMAHVPSIGFARPGSTASCSSCNLASTESPLQFLGLIRHVVFKQSTACHHITYCTTQLNWGSLVVVFEYNSTIIQFFFFPHRSCLPDPPVKYTHSKVDYRKCR